MATGHDFEIVLTHLRGYALVKLCGDLDYETTVEHAGALREVIDVRDRVIVDLADMRFVDSAGIAFLVRLANAHEGAVRLENVHSQVGRVLALTGLAERFDVSS